MPFTYICKDSFLHKMNPAVKLLFLLLLTCGSFIVKNTLPAVLSIAVYTAFTLSIICLTLLCAIPLSVLLCGSKGVFFMLFFIIAFGSVNFNPISFNKEGLISTLFFSWSMLLSFSAGSLLFAVTKMTELKNVLFRITGSKRISLGLSLMLNFIPRFFYEWEKTKYAYRARAGKNGIIEIITIIPPVTHSMMQNALKTATALQARALNF
ncbi:MAG: hypothetical protein Ta2F_05210 [Termitinemataceae bacterium]|nr:MAG: hypothetical protein Ta2F_05210 [Termitinemataceae bacterium]